MKCFSVQKLLSVSTLLFSVVLIAACDSAEKTESPAADVVAVNDMQQTTEATPEIVELLRVYKSETCGCCGDWVEHMNENGFPSSIHHPEDLNVIKDEYGVNPAYQSCHTAVSEEGYVFEGHVPAKYVKQFLDNVPEDATGLTVPGMPLGSPGMEVDDRFMPYDILLLKKDGSTEVYASVETYQQQF